MIKIEKITKERGLSLGEVAKHLFPENNRPMPALKRVLEGETELRESQIKLFASLCGCTIAELYSDAWRDSMSTEGDIVTFSMDGFTAKLNRKTGVSTVYKNGTLKHEEVLHDPNMPVSKYIDMLNRIIEEYD